MKNTAAIILSGGEGTRLNSGQPSPVPKVLYEVAGKPLIKYSVDVLEKIGVQEIIIVVGYKGDEIKKFLGARYRYSIQENPLGTGDATSSGLKVLSENVQKVIVLYGGDIYAEKVIKGALDEFEKEASVVTLVTKILDEPFGFGRIVRDEKGKLKAIVEHKVATDEEKKIKEVNDGCFIFERSWLYEKIKEISLSKSKEYFLTDLIEMAISKNEKVATFTIKNAKDWIGVDSPEDIRNAEKILKG